MFTGIVETKLPILDPRVEGEGLDFGLDLGPLEGAAPRLGDSIAVNGCCLTIARLEAGEARFHAGRETLSLTNLGAIRAGSLVNVERALRFGDQLGGHMVSGHVDGVGRVAEIVPEDSQTVMRFELPERLMKEVILKGSIALDGVSLTLTEIVGRVVAVALIPHTLAITTLGDVRVGDPINVETDMIGKWILKQTGPINEQLNQLLQAQGDSPR
ncbi:MAG: riboflavin synthase [Planctomycetes bacterium]|nr:riboflavin synthase [Planctomycetota bacterium]